MVVGVEAFTQSIISKQINILQPLNVQTSTESDQLVFGADGVNPIFVVIPVAAVAAVSIFFLRKKNILEGITEKISFGGKISEVKERITQLRDR